MKYQIINTSNFCTIKSVETRSESVGRGFKEKRRGNAVVEKQVDEN